MTKGSKKHNGTRDMLTTTSDKAETRAKSSETGDTGSGANKGHRWKKGQSGNPLGRRSGMVRFQGVMVHISELARAHTKAAIDCLVRLLKSSDERVVIQAAQALLDRGWGKATEVVHHATVEPQAPIEIVFRAADGRKINLDE